MKQLFLWTIPVFASVAFLLFVGCYPATALDTDTYSDSESESESDTDTGSDTGEECEDFCLDNYLEEIPGCLAFCGGIGMVVCDSNDLECVYSPDVHPDQGGLCIPTARLECYEDVDCACMPTFETACYGAGAVWTCPTTQCVPSCPS